MTNHYDHAAALAAHGFHVFPLPPLEKIADWTDYASRATFDLERLRAFWSCPVLEIVQPFNPAISTTRYGLADQPLIGIDVDVKEGKGGLESLRALEARGLVLPRTFNQTTPTRGLHFLMTSPFPLRQIVSRADRPGPLGPGIDTRSRGGYLVGAGAETSKGVYSAEWLPVAEAPEWLIELLGPAEEVTRTSAGPAAPIDAAAALARARWYLANDAPPAVKGRGGDATTLNVAMAVRDLGVLEPDECLKVMLELYVPRCVPPDWTEAKLKVKVRNAYRYAKRGAGAASPEVLLAGAGEPPAAAPGAPTEDDAHLPSIVVDNRQLRDEVDDSWAALRRANRRAPAVFQRCGRLVRARLQDERGPQIEPVERDWLSGHLTRVADWVKKTSKGRMNVRPPEAVPRDMIARPVSDLPVLETVGTEPVFTASGLLVATEGYNPEARYYLHGQGGRALADVPDEPTNYEIEDAREFLIRELLADFPFVEDADRAHAFAALLLPLVRRLITGPTPLHVIEAPTIGTGKSELAKVLTLVATGREAPALPFPTTEEEFSKTITTVLLEAAPAVLLDNAPERVLLRSPSFAAVLTADFASGRLLGKNEAPTLPNRALWLMTGNNPRLAGDWARRCVRVRLNRNAERPWLAQTAWRHPELIVWAAGNRGSLLRALTVLVRGWLARGRPAGAARPMASFVSWSNVLGGILEVAGVGGFLANLADLHEASDPEAGEWSLLTKAWWVMFGSAPVTVAQVSDVADSKGLLIETLGAGNSVSKTIRLGRALAGERDAIHGGFRIARASRPQRGENASYYQLRQIDGKPLPEPIREYATNIPANIPALEKLNQSGLEGGSGNVGNVGNTLLRGGREDDLI